jgi:hypothetical protein
MRRRWKPTPRWQHRPDKAAGDTARHETGRQSCARFYAIRDNRRKALTDVLMAAGFAHGHVVDMDRDFCALAFNP